MTIEEEDGERREGRGSQNSGEKKTPTSRRRERRATNKSGNCKARDTDRDAKEDGICVSKKVGRRRGSRGCLATLVVHIKRIALNGEGVVEEGRGSDDVLEPFFKCSLLLRR